MSEKLNVEGLGDTGENASSIDKAVRASSESFSQDIDGICTATVVVTGNYFKVINLGGKEEEHPDISWLVKTNFGVQRLDGTLGRGTFTYKGCPKNKSYYRYNIDSDASAQPIETHPFFKNGKDIPENITEITGDDAWGYRFGDRIKGTEPKGSAQAFYDQSDLSPSFKHFPISAQFDLPGVQQFFQMGMTFNLISVTHVE